MAKCTSTEETSSAVDLLRVVEELRDVRLVLDGIRDETLNRMAGKLRALEVALLVTLQDGEAQLRNHLDDLEANLPDLTGDRREQQLATIDAIHRLLDG